MNKLYQQTHPPVDYKAMVDQMLQSNPKLQSVIDIVKHGRNPKELFYTLAKQRGVDPNSILSQIPQQLR